MAAMATYAAALKVDTKGDEEVVAAEIDVHAVEEVAPTSNIEETIIDAEASEHVVAAIDAALETGPSPALASSIHEPTIVPDNYRAPPTQNVKARERRDRPNIHDHGLLKSMDLGFVSGSFDTPTNRRSTGPIGFLSQGGSGFKKPEQK